MARTDNLTNYLTDVASAIKEKKGDSTPILASNFDTEIANLPSGGNLQSKSITITENGITTLLPDTGYDGMDEVEITTDVSGGGSTEPEEKDVNFYDYDGTRLYSYTASEFLALESMPQEATHEGLTSQGWNWNLTEAKTFVTSYGILDIGQTYITDDGATRLYITVGVPITMTLKFAVNGTALVDWGDGNTDNVTGTSLTISRQINHTYENIGDYVISIKEDINGIAFNDNGGMLYGSDPNITRKIKSMVTKVELGKISISQSRTTLFQYYANLKYITIPNNITSLHSTSFGYCTGLEFLVIPKNFTSISSSLFTHCENIKRIILPNTITGIASSSFEYCASLEKMILPTTITSAITGNNDAISTSNIQNIFQNCTSLEYILAPFDLPNNTVISNFVNCKHIKKAIIGITKMGTNFSNSCNSLEKVIFIGDVISIANNSLTGNYSAILYDFSNCTSVPTLGGNAFSNNILFKIVVPDSLYDDWIVAQYWSDYAQYIVKASEYYN